MNKGFSQYFCLIIEESGSGSRRPENIRIHNTGLNVQELSRERSQDRIFSSSQSFELKNEGEQKEQRTCAHDSGAAIQRRAEGRPVGRRRRGGSPACGQRGSRGGWNWSRWQSPPRPPPLTSCPLGWPAAQGSPPTQQVISSNHVCGNHKCEVSRPVFIQCQLAIRNFTHFYGRFVIKFT